MGDSNEDMFSGISLGKWNVLYITTVCLTQASLPAQIYSSIFVNMPIDFRCGNTVSRQINETFDNSCYINVRNTMNSENNKSLQKCTTFEFNTTEVSSTFTSEFQLVCEKAWLSAMYSMILPIGSYIGTFFLGASDKWGRVSVIQISSIIYAGGAFITGLAKHECIVLLGRFLVGFSFPILNWSAIPLSLETMSPKNRSTVGFLMFIPFYVFVVFLGILGYFIREWRMLYLSASFPIFFIPFIALFLDKSPRWLIQEGRVDEAKIVMQKAASINKGNVSFDFSSIEKDTNTEKNEQNIETISFLTILQSGKELIQQLYSTTIMLKISVILPFLWFFNGIVYFGIPLHANGFTGNSYLYIIMIGAAELPLAFLGPLVIKSFGNIKTGICFFLIIGVCMLDTLFVTENTWWVKWIFVMLSMACSGTITTICNLLTSELFPTVLRSTGYGLSISAHFVGFFLSSFINSTLISKTWWEFNTVCGVCCIVAAILISLLPETQGQQLCETVNEVNNRKYKNYKDVIQLKVSNVYKC